MPKQSPDLKKACRLTDLQSSLTDEAVYPAYVIAAVPAERFLYEYGYKRSLRLALYAVGTDLFIPVAATRSYDFFWGYSKKEKTGYSNNIPGMRAGSSM